MFRTLSEVKAANSAAGGKFFDKPHRESPVSRRIYPTEHGAIIVSSVARDDYRHWLVWWADSATGAITSAKAHITSDSAAHTFARDLARLDGWGNGPKQAPAASSARADSAAWQSLVASGQTRCGKRDPA